MLSILIPIYNQPCLALVTELSKQSSKENIPFEIICIDDHSPSIFEENKTIADIPNCVYIELEENIGRSRIRNLLAKKAQYEYLIFLDCDSKIVHPDYIKNYLKYLPQIQVISGGRIYEDIPPKNSSYLLHWKYGTYREPKSIDGQNQVFMSNNFIIKKSILKQIPFRASITKYGHEDSLFQIDLKQRGYNIFFIDNPIMHIGLDTSIDFISKVKLSTETLWELYKTGEINKGNSNNLKLLSSYIKIKKFGLNKLFSFKYILCKKLFETNLLSKHPSLFILNIYKLCYLSYIDLIEE
ncbi:MAG: glycosyltransferase [Candidatus Azobacteroides sp.]|nr:glycosyltransferase [Candidatus Azobacteroides sp.]